MRYDQTAAGYRTGIEPVLLAASVPVRPGERVLEAGCGAGAGLLCLAARVGGIAGLGVEREGGLAALAARNAAANGMPALRFAAADLLTAEAEVFGPLPFDHAMANPPWHAAGGTASPDRLREAAKRAGPGLLAAWCSALARRLRRGGTLTLILPAPQAFTAAAALGDCGCGAIALFPLWPRQGRAARLVLLRGVTGSRAPARVAAGLVLHAAGGYGEAAEAVLRHGAALDLGS